MPRPFVAQSIEYLYRSAVAEIRLYEIVYHGGYLSVDCHAGVAYLKSVVALYGGCFEASAYHSVDVGSVTDGVVCLNVNLKYGS